MSSGLFIATRELSEQGDQLVEQIGKSGDTCFITAEGRAKAVLMDIQHYNALMDLVEEAELPSDKHDLANDSGKVSVREILKTNSSRIPRS